MQPVLGRPSTSDGELVGSVAQATFHRRPLTRTGVRPPRRLSDMLKRPPKDDTGGDDAENPISNEQRGKAAQSASVAGRPTGRGGWSWRAGDRSGRVGGRR